MAVKWYLRTSVTHGCDTMTLKYNHLERRNHTFYFRYRVPSWVRHIFEKECIRYSLNTNDYNIAIHLVKRESFKYDTLLNDIRWLVMEIRNGKLHLSQDDIENIIAQRIKEIQDKLDESYYKIKNGEISPTHLEMTMLEEKDYMTSGFMGSFEEFTLNPNNYAMGRDATRQLQNDLQQQHPIAYGVGEFTGAMTTPMHLAKDTTFANKALNAFTDTINASAGYAENWNDFGTNLVANGAANWLGLKFEQLPIFRASAKPLMQLGKKFFKQGINSSADKAKNLFYKKDDEDEEYYY